MAVKYRIEYDDISEVTTRIDIADSAYVGSVIELQAAADPLEIYIPMGEDIFTPVQGSGGSIYVLAKDSDDLRSLYTPNPQKYTVVIYKFTSPTPVAADAIFYGYINTNFYTEPFDEYELYPIQIGFNDGLAVLDKFDYLDSGSEYTGTDSAWDVINRLLTFIPEITFKDIRVVSDMDYSGYTINNDTIFEHLKVSNQNYYDESDKPMTCREVLESILLSLGMIAFTQDGSLYIIDPLKLEEASYTAYIFNASTGLYSGSATIFPNKGIGVTVENWVTGKTLDFSESYTQLNVDYLGYSGEVTGNENWQDSSEHSSAGTWSLYTDPYGADYLKNTTWGGISGYTLNGAAEWIGTQLSVTDPQEFHVGWNRATPIGWGDSNNTTGLRWSLSPPSEIHRVSGQYVLLRFKMFTQAQSGYYPPYNPEPNDSSFEIFGLEQKMRIKIGDYYWDMANQIWTLTDTTSMMTLKSDLPIANQWTEYNVIIPMSGVCQGEVDIDFYDYSRGLDSNWEYDGGIGFNQTVIRFKDLGIVACDASGAELDFDKRYECYIDNQWGGEAPDIEILHGDSSDGVSTHKAGFIGDSDRFATGFQYGNMTTWEHLSVVLVKKYCSQYQDPRMILTGRLTCNDIYTSGLAKTGNISDGTYLPGKKFVLLKGTYNDKDRYISGTWIEILTDDILIGDITIT